MFYFFLSLFFLIFILTFALWPGHGKIKFCLAPKKVNTFASFIKLNSNYSHNVCIATQQKYLNPKLAEKLINPKNVFEPLIETVLDKNYCTSVNKFNCCKIDNPIRKSNFRVGCETCNLKYVCYYCSKICHSKHKLVRYLPDLTPEKPIETAIVKPKKGEAQSAFSRLTQGSGNFRVKKIAVPKPTEDAPVVPEFRPISRPSSNQTKDAKPHPARRSFRSRSRTRSRADSEANHDKARVDKIILDTINCQREVKLVNDYDKTKHLHHHCQCGIYNLKCKIPPKISEFDEEDVRVTAAVKIQRLGRR